MPRTRHGKTIRRSATMVLHSVTAAPCVQLLMLRILVNLKVWATEQWADFRLADVLDALGMHDLLPDEDLEDEKACAALRPGWQLMLRELDPRGDALATFPDGLQHNLYLLGRHLGLNRAEQCVLGFAVLTKHELALQSCIRMLGDQSRSRLVAIVSHMLGMDSDAIKQALMPQGALARTGLMQSPTAPNASLLDWLEIASRSFTDAMIEPQQSVVGLLRGLLREAPASTLTVADYAHLAEDVTLASAYLRAALEARRRGVNVLLYGPPGTGKTELASVLAREVNTPLFEVAIEQSNGERLKWSSRLQAAKLAQSMLATASGLLLFDEAEDVFSGWVARGSTKAYLNRLLEETVTPTVWIANTTDGLDPAYARRFDLAIHLGVPPRARRMEILRRACPLALDDTELRRLADHPQLAPAVVTRAVSVVGLALGDRAIGNPKQAFFRAVDATLRVQHLAPLGRAGMRTALPFDPAFVHASVDLPALAAQLRARPDLRICLSGPPGTGKSEFGRWLAEQTDRPLHLKRASDLLSMWVGGTEKAIASAFRKAEADDAVLLLDEVDGFLRHRGATDHGWEVTAINELLTQMETFRGCLVATTNRFEGLDPAALRRFDLKLQFGYLDATRAWALFRAFCARMGLVAPDPALQEYVAQLEDLAPGDFAVAARQCELGRIGCAPDLLRALQEEIALKPKPRRPMGFQLPAADPPRAANA